MRHNISGESPYEPIIGFSRAVRVGNVVHLSGTGPVGADQQDAAGQTRRIFAIAADALKLAGCGFEHEFFGAIRPAATMVVVAKLLNPVWRIEIEMDAIIPETSGTA